MIRAMMVATALGALCLPAPVQAETVLEKVVIFSRHGVRPPTNQKKLNPLSVEAWPEWSVPDGDLTPHGAQAAKLMGEYYRQRFAKPGFLDPDRCPGEGEVFTWADRSQRTVATGKSLLAGMFPACPLNVGSSRKAKEAAALFHPIEGGIAPLDPELARKSVMEAMGGSFDAMRARLAPDFARLAGVLRGPHEKLCEKADLGATCALADLPWGLKVQKKKGYDVELTGPLALASTVTEVFRLEYSNGKPLSEVGWGRIGSAAEVEKLLVLHRADYAVVKSAPYPARRGASQILHQIALALRPDADGKGPPGSKLLLLVGHDGNIAQIRGALGISWKLNGYPENDTPPAGALVFERLRDTGTNETFVRASYVAQGMDQIRNLAPPTGADLPESAVLVLPGCAPVVEGACKLSSFIDSLTQRIDRTALGPVSFQ